MAKAFLGGVQGRKAATPTCLIPQNDQDKTEATNCTLNNDMPTAPSSANIHPTLERLRKNDVTFAKLKLVQPIEDYAPNFEEFLECLRHNTTVKYVLLGDIQTVREGSETIAVVR